MDAAEDTSYICSFIHQMFVDTYCVLGMVPALECFRNKTAKNSIFVVGKTGKGQHMR